MFCKKCGQPIPDDSDFCPKCGHAQNEVKEILYKDEDKIACPKCGSTQITSNKKGFSAGKAIGGAVLTGGIGLLFGLHGSGKIKLSCLKCGNSWMAGKSNPQIKKQEPLTTGGCIVGIVIFVILALAVASGGC